MANTYTDFADLDVVRRITLSGFAGDPDYLTTQTVPVTWVVKDLPGAGGRPATGIAFAVTLTDASGLTVAPGSGTFSYRLFTFASSTSIVSGEAVTTIHAINVGAAVTSQAFSSLIQLTPRRCATQKYALQLTSFASVPGTATHAVVMVGGL